MREYLAFFPKWETPDLFFLLPRWVRPFYRFGVCAALVAGKTLLLLTLIKLIVETTTSRITMSNVPYSAADLSTAMHRCSSRMASFAVSVILFCLLEG
jgi:hypothetical protein